MHASSTRSRSRVTRHINYRPASNIHHAVRIAERIGLPITHMVTINFSLTAIPADEASAAFAQLRNNRFGPWMRRPSRRSGHAACAPTFTWSIEGTGGVTAAHWLVHLPRGRISDFTERLPAWLAAIVGAEPEPGAIDIKPAYGPRGAGRYISKGVDPRMAAFLGIRHEDQGQVHGKRSGVSQNLGPAVKKAMRATGAYPKAYQFRPAKPVNASGRAKHPIAPASGRPGGNPGASP